MMRTLLFKAGPELKASNPTEFNKRVEALARKVDAKIYNLLDANRQAAFLQVIGREVELNDKK